MSIAKKLMTTGAKGDTYVDDVFSTYVYEGTGATHDIVNGIDLAGEGGLVWLKRRDTYEDNYLHDTERGTGVRLLSNSTSTEQDVGLSSFNADGFSVSASQYVESGADYASWTWRKQKKFFDVVTYTGDGTFNRSISHNLGAQAGMVIVKCTSHSEDWAVCHRSATGGGANLNTTGGFNSSAFDLSLLSDTAFGVQGRGQTNASGQEYVAYVFAHDDSDESMIKCGSYTGNNSSKPEIDLGWEPQWVMIKAVEHSDSWVILDTMRGIVTEDSSGGGSDPKLFPNSGNAESASSTSFVELMPNGFRINGGDYLNNAPGEEYIYMAIRRPNKPAEEFDPEELFAVNNAVSGAPSWVSGFPVDMNIQKNAIDTAGPYIWSRLMQGKRLRTHGTNPEDSEGAASFDYQNGISEGQGYQLDTQYAWMWRRAPGFFDVVTYDGDGQAGREVPHNLGVAPEMMWVKKRTAIDQWYIYAAPLGINQAMYLNDNSASFVDNLWNNTDPAEYVFTVNNRSGVNGNGQSLIAYLFASLPGVSKVGSYTGTGVAGLDIDCGFTNGARFVLIKRTDAAESWNFWDTARGITTGNDPKLTLDSTAAQYSFANYLNPLPSGFTVDTSGSDLNANGGEYIFYAIA
jgi:hypothetical protein